MLHTDFYPWGNCEQNREILHFNISYFRAMKSRTKQRSMWHVMSTQERHSGFSFHLKWPTKYWNSTENKNENYLICCIYYVKSRMVKDVQMSHVFVSWKSWRDSREDMSLKMNQCHLVSNWLPYRFWYNFWNCQPLSQTILVICILYIPIVIYTLN